MINLMYLVLTAMLALQVSSTIIDKFIFLNASLEHSLVFARQASEASLGALKKKVEKDPSAEGTKAVRRAEELKKKTAEMISYIDKIKAELILKSGGMDKETGLMKNPKDEEATAQYMVGQGGSKSGKGYELETRLDAFVEELYKTYGDLPGVTKKDNFFPDLAEGNENNPLYAKDPIQRGKDFAKASFEQTPVVAALALLTQKQSELVRYEQEILKKLGAFDTPEIKFDQVKAAATPNANTVASGSDYIAEMFLFATSSKTDLKMTVNGSPIRVKDGIGEVRIPTGGAGEFTWKGAISFNNKGKDTTFTFEKKYTVVEPVLLVKAKANFPLYLNCPNPLETSVPALGASYNPSYSVSNGRAVPGGKTGDVTLIPSALGKCILTVRSDGKQMGTAEFRVDPVPPPSVYLASANGTKINPEQPLPNVPSVSVVVEPDATFRNTLPQEANYRITSVEVFQYRIGRVIKQAKSSGLIQLSGFDVRPGDGFQAKILGVQRVGTTGVEEVRVSNPYISWFAK
ncbi:MAG: gliding motility protein GldM [Microscillaceae bacterium]